MRRKNDAVIRRKERGMFALQPLNHESVKRGSERRWKARASLYGTVWKRSFLICRIDEGDKRMKMHLWQKIA